MRELLEAKDRRPSVTMVRVASSRIPEDARPRLLRLARAGLRVFLRHGARLQAEMAMALELAIGDLELNERRATNGEGRARRAELDLAVANTQIAELKREIAELKRGARDEFSTESTALRSDPTLIDACRKGLP